MNNENVTNEVEVAGRVYTIGEWYFVGERKLQDGDPVLVLDIVGDGEPTWLESVFNQPPCSAAFFTGLYGFKAEGFIIKILKEW